MFLGRACRRDLEPELQSTSILRPSALGTTSLPRVLARETPDLLPASCRAPLTPAGSPPPANTLTRPGFSVPAREVQWKLERKDVQCDGTSNSFSYALVPFISVRKKLLCWFPRLRSYQTAQTVPQLLFTRSSRAGHLCSAPSVLGDEEGPPAPLPRFSMPWIQSGWAP